MSKLKFNSTGGGTNKSWKLAILFLSIFISLTPITTLIACNKKVQNPDEDPMNDKTSELINNIKSTINNFLSNPNLKINLDNNDLKKDKVEIKNLLQPFFEKANKNLNDEIFIDNANILNRIIEEINKVIIVDLNDTLKKQFLTLENIDQIVTLNALKAKMNGNDIDTLLKLIDKKPSQFAADDLKVDFDYNLQLTLEFNINLKNRQDNFIYKNKSAFITTNKNNLYDLITKLANKLSESLANQELNGKTIIDNVLNNNITYEESFSNALNNILSSKNIKITKSQNMEINREELSFQLKSSSAKDNRYMKDFANFIHQGLSAITTSEQMFDNDFINTRFYQFDDYSVRNGKVFIKEFAKFEVLLWTIEGIELPKRNLNNIKIYHEITQIKESWEKFYKILDNYLFNENFDIYSSANSWVKMWGKYESLDDIRKYKIETVIRNWSKPIKEKLKNGNISVLDNFLEEIDTKNATYYGGNSEKIDIIDINIKLFLSQLSWSFLNQKYSNSIHFFYKK